MANIK
jgi:hypothetical protein